MKSINNTKDKAPHTGKLITTFIKKESIFKSALARYLKRSAPTIEYHLRRPTLQTKLLWELSVALNHNFFLDIAAQLPKEFTSNVPIDNTKDNEIKNLLEENKVLKANITLLKKLMQKNI